MTTRRDFVGVHVAILLVFPRHLVIKHYLFRERSLTLTLRMKRTETFTSDKDTYFMYVVHTLYTALCALFAAD